MIAILLVFITFVETVQYMAGKKFSNAITHNDRWPQWKPKDTYAVIDQLFPCEPSKKVALAILFAGKIMQTPEVINEANSPSIVGQIIRFADEFRSNV